MSRTNGASYEGFRRKSSLTTLEGGKNGQGLELTLAKLKHNDHLEEVLSLSAQLDCLSKRSFTARPYSDYTLTKSYSSTSLQDPTEPITDRRQTSSASKEQGQVIMEGEKEWMEGERAGEKERRDKISSSAIFNKFEVIEEDNYLNEEEVVESVEPVTLKPVHPPKQLQKKVLPPKSNAVKIPQQAIPPRKPAVPSSRVDPLPKKERLRQDLSEIDKLQKEFDAKKGVRQTASKSNLQMMGKRSMKEPAAKEKEVAKGLKQSLQLESKTQLDSSLRLNRNTLKGSLVIGSKPVQQKPDSFLALDEEKSEEFNDEKREPMVATRMLNSKEKQGLVDRLRSLQEVIGKNDVCANSLSSITSYIGKIEQLLTR